MMRGAAMIKFIQDELSIPEGMNTGSRFVLRQWQQDIIKAVYDPVGEDGLRMVRKAIYSVAKKNGKTPFVAAIALGHLCGPEAKINEQIYAAAFDRDQAAITFRYMSQMVNMSSKLSSGLVIRATTKEIYCPTNGSVFKALSSEVKGKHGLGPAVLIMDELAQFGVDRTFYDTLSQGRGAHLEPILWIISTQSPDDLAVLSQEIDNALRVADPEGPDYDPTIHITLRTTPIDIDAYDPENWKLSNPALGDFLNIKDMEEAARAAKAMPSAEGNFRNLRLNQRIDATAHFITPDLWKGCGEAPDPETFAGREWWGGLDLSGKNDLTSLELVSQADDGIWDVLSFFWAPGDNLRQKEDRDRAPYTVWRDKGFLIAKPGKVIDYRWVAAKIGELRDEFNIAGIKFDRWRISDLRREMDAIGLDTWILGEDWKEETPGAKPEGLCLVPHGQGFRDFTPAVENLEDMLMDKKLRHGMNPPLTWCASNVRIQADPAGGRKFDKLRSTGRIDGIVALAMALNGATSRAEEGESVYETRGVLSF
jgi:phage terminase large subunit-like protein